VRVSAFSVSLDGFGAGPSQDINNPLGVRGPELHGWFHPTEVFHAMRGQAGGSTGVDNEVGKESMAGMGAWIMGRNMFGPIRGNWPDDSWKGWWGPNPPYHCKVFVLTHHARPDIEMEGGTRFCFVTDGIESALKQARQAADGKDIRIGGGVSVVRQFLKAGLIDEMHLAFSPVFIGAGEHLLEGINLPGMGFELASKKQGENALHVYLKKK
jgi:dihydrofolate reductase